MAFAAGALQNKRFATRHIRHPDTLMPGQIREDGRPSPRRQIIRRGHEQTPRLAKGPQFQRAVRERPEAKRDIDTLADEIHPLIGEAEVNANVRMTVLKSEDQPADVQDTEGRRAAYPDRAGGRATRAPGLIAGLFDKTQYLDAVGIIAAAFSGHRDTPGRPAEQRHADRFFELPHVPRDRRLPNPKFPRDRRQAATLGHANEATHTLECNV
ncbi:hypothetical protein MesoLj113a_55050 [Mesorhizobium sp. 113-1-2]|nr:hypothetical protein MesoLj113a_55050 [Mesorhizobium sp. 113-1-2]